MAERLKKTGKTILEQPKLYSLFVQKQKHPCYGVLLKVIL